MSPVVAAGPALSDLLGDPMPAGEIARLGSARWRISGEPRRIVVSADGKTLGKVTAVTQVNLLDAGNGRSVDRGRTASFGIGIDQRMAMAVDWEARKRHIADLKIQWSEHRQEYVSE